MKRIYQLLSLALLLVLTQKSYALACKKDGTQAADAVMINTTIAVPNNLPKDTVLWRSDNIQHQHDLLAGQGGWRRVRLFLSKPSRPGPNAVRP
ncbi:hypothetical protein C4K14_4021 [Pseudomonas chlororaphis subsp. aureofaciens]|nr:hypothetical protein C4K14_4021 [Pseudomonas chlororaphis subsp. aureofaciens]